MADKKLSKNEKKKAKMKLAQIIITLMDTDLYKFTMQQVILHRFPGVDAYYAFKCRNKPGVPLAEMVEEINAQIDALCELRFKPEELAYLRTLRYLKSDYVDFLEGFQLRRRFITVKADGDDILIEARGPMVQVMMFEIYVLAIVNEVYFSRFNTPAVIAEGVRRMKSKVQDILTFFDMPSNRAANPLELFDFGTRRRFSREWQEKVVSGMQRAIPDYFKGTSNVDLARRYGITPIGTMAHEYLQAFQQLGPRLKDFQKAALEAWVQEYRGDLGIALTDVVGMDAFLRDFDLYFAKLFDGIRHDSGSPFEWTEKAIAHYEKLKVPVYGKRFTYSDSLNVPLIIELYKRYANTAKLGFGWGTNLTNDMGIEPLQIVMKIVECNGAPVAKLPDTAGKTMSNNLPFLQYLAQTFERELS